MRVLNAESIGIVVVDDQRSYGEALTLALGVSLPADRVWCADSVDELFGDDDRADLGADVVLLDWQLDGVDGIDITRRLAELDDAPHIVMVTGHHSAALERMAIRAGACAALPKHASVADITAAIERCRRGEAHGAEHAEQAASPAPVLSDRQVEVLWLLSSGLDTREVAARLYLSVATVRTYTRDALRRLGAHSQLEGVAIARRAGLIPMESAPPFVSRS